MYVKTFSGYIPGDSFEITEKGLLDTFFPETTQSASWKYWRAILDPKLCPECLEHHGKVYAVDETPPESPPLHENCRCDILHMGTITPGKATTNA